MEIGSSLKAFAKKLGLPVPAPAAPPPAKAPTMGKDQLSLGADPQVRVIQLKLAELGFYKGKTDGRFEKSTTDALQAFMKSKGIPLGEGAISDKTLDALGVPRWVDLPE